MHRAKSGKKVGKQVGAAAQVVPATVVSARTVKVEASASSKNLGAGAGAAVGLGAGQLLGRGKGQVASAVGFGLLGALTGMMIGKEAGQELMVKLDGSNQQYSVIQPIYKEVGAIPVGTHGSLYIGASDSKFLPDGF